MKVAVELIEKRVRTVIVEAENYDEASEKVMDAYDKGDITLNYDNASIEAETKDDTTNYIEIFGEKEFMDMEATEL